MQKVCTIYYGKVLGNHKKDSFSVYWNYLIYEEE